MRNKNRPLNIDLLRNRRNVADNKLPYFASTRQLIWKGGFIGASILLLTLTISALIYARTMLYENSKNELISYVDEYDKLEAKLNDESRKMKDLANFNNKLAKNIYRIISSSAFLKEITNSIPTNIELTSLSIDSEKITFEGITDEEIGLETINMFLLKLSDSLFFSKNIVINNIESNNNNSDSDFESNSLEFTLTATFNSDLEYIDKDTLLQLGSIGLSNRIDYLEKAGFDK